MGDGAPAACEGSRANEGRALDVMPAAARRALD
jgi:hypothetical protein